MMYLEDKSVNNHPTQIVNHHCLDKVIDPTSDLERGWLLVSMIPDDLLER